MTKFPNLNTASLAIKTHNPSTHNKNVIENGTCTPTAAVTSMLKREHQYDAGFRFPICSDTRCKIAISDPKQIVINLFDRLENSK